MTNKVNHQRGVFMRKTTMVAIAIAMWTVLLVIVGLPLWRHVSTQIRFYKADFFVRDVAVYCKRHGELPLNIQSFCLESARERATQSISEYAQNYQQYVENHFVIKRITKRQLLEGEDFFKILSEPDDFSDLLNRRLRDLIRDCDGNNVD